MNFQALQDRTHLYLGKRADVTSADLADAVNDAYQKLCVGRFVDFYRRERVMYFPELETTASVTLVDGQDTYSISSDWYSVLAVYHKDKSTTPNRYIPLSYKKPKAFYVFPPNSGRPFCYTWEGGYIKIRNVPDSTLTSDELFSLGYKLPARMSASGDSPVIPEVWHPLIALLAAANIAETFGSSELAQQFRNRFAYELATTRQPRDVPTDAHMVHRYGGG